MTPQQLDGIIKYINLVVAELKQIHADLKLMDLRLIEIEKKMNKTS